MARRLEATATVAAYASLCGLGRYLIDGIKVRQFHIALVGALLVTVLDPILVAQPDLRHALQRDIERGRHVVHGPAEHGFERRRRHGGDAGRW